MTNLARLMPGYDPNWRDKIIAAKLRERELLALERALTAAEEAELFDIAKAIDKAYNARFRTTKEYRDFYFAYALELLENEGIDMPLPHVPEDATPEQVDRVLAMVWQAIEVTNSENF